MRPFSFFLLFLISTWLANGQELKKITKKNRRKGYIEVYYVLKSNKEIKHGAYQRLSPHKAALLEEGFFKNNQRDSLWKTYYFSRNVKSAGFYKMDIEVGDWKFYSPSAELYQECDYTQRTILSYKSDFNPDHKDSVMTSQGITLMKLDRPPLYLGGYVKISEQLNRLINYPTFARDNNITGTVYISFFIDEKSDISEYYIEKGIGGGCDEAALAAVKQLKNYWIPGEIQGKKVKTKYFLPVRFELF